MKVIKPNTITVGMVAATTATETYATWSSATTYALTDRKVYGNYIYESIQGSNLNKQPDTNPLWWSLIGPSNKWAMFDSEINTNTIQASPLTVSVSPGLCNSISVLGITGTAISIVVKNGVGGATVYSKSLSLDGTVINDWYQYFFEPFVQRGEVVLTDLPPYSNAYVTVSITGSGSVGCGQLSLGTFYQLGNVQSGATAGITDYSRKDTDSFGATTLVKRAFSKRMSVNLQLNTVEINKLQRILSDLRATPCTWIGSENTQTYSPLVVWGFYRDFSINIAYPTISFCSLEVEGLI